MDKFEDFNILVQKCINMCEENRDKIMNGLDECTPGQLDIILIEMNEFLKIDKNTEPIDIKKRYCKCYQNAVYTWGWSLKQPTELMNILQKVDKAFLYLWSEKNSII